jgi:hypothetical protein
MDRPLVKTTQYGPARDACVGPHTGLQRSSWHTMEHTEAATEVPDVLRDDTPALTGGIDPESLVHHKDSLQGWKEQYQGPDIPSISFHNIKSSQHVNLNMRYPPVPPPKVGRPKSTKRIKGADEVQLSRKRAKVQCSACGKFGHNKRAWDCPSKRKGADAAVGGAAAQSTSAATPVPAADEVWQAIPSHLGIVGSPEGQGEKRGREQVRFVRGDGEGWGGGGPCGEGSSSRPAKSAKPDTVSKPVKKKATVAKVAAKGKKATKKK